MHLTSAKIIGLAFVGIALALLPEKYQPKWIQQLKWWQILIGLVATVVALLIVMNPEFYALGILGDSTFFDLLAVAIGIQLQTVFSRVGVYVLAGGARVARFLHWRFCIDCMLIALAVADIASAIQRLAHRLIS